VLISVIIPTRNPNPERFRRTLAGLRAQTLSEGQWETVVIDNSSTDPVMTETLTSERPANLRVVREEQLGLTHARRRGLLSTETEFGIFVDDDNVLCPSYLERAIARFAEWPAVGLLGGPSIPEFERPPEPWHKEFHSLLALREVDPEIRISQGLRPPGQLKNTYPAFAPIGAGLSFRRSAVTRWLKTLDTANLTDRCGDKLTSGGDNDIVLSALQDGWEVAYAPELILTHLIPPGRLEKRYLGRLNYGIQESWVRVLSKYNASPWPPIPRWTVRLRQAKALFACRPWTGPAAYVRWRGICGRLQGLGQVSK
jgi:glycosyltransferase involved in cell wall biosynthesis